MPSSSVEMPRTATPWAAKSWCSLLKLGISLMHGTHHVAQKLTTTIFPESAAVSRLPPSSFDAWGRDDAAAVDGAHGAATAALTACGGAGLFRKARYSGALLVDPGNCARIFSSGSTMA